MKQFHPTEEAQFDLYSYLVSSGERNMLLIGSDFVPEEHAATLKLPWSTVFTTIQDSDTLDKLRCMLEADNRKVRVISRKDATNDQARMRVSNSFLDKYYLTLIRLFDEQCDAGTKKPSPKQNKAAREILNVYAVELLKTHGRLFCLNYTENDLLSPGYLMECLSEIGEAQNGHPCVYFFGMSSEMHNKLIADYDDTDYLVQAQGRLEDILTQFLPDLAESSRAFLDTEKSESSLMFYLDGKTKCIDEKKEVNILSFARLLEFDMMNPSPKPRDKYKIWFPAFLKNDDPRPKWYGYREGFMLEREYQEKLLRIVRYALENPGTSNQSPVLLHGQSGSGKTITMQWLAYTIFHERKFPVVYITDPDVRFFYDALDNNDAMNPNENLENLVLFLKYLQTNEALNARAILLIWDCSGLDKERNDYRKLHRILTSRGINAVLVCTSYTLDERSKKKKGQFRQVPADITLNGMDIENLDILLRDKAQMDDYSRQHLISDLRKSRETDESVGKNFLGMLYHVFVDIRPDLSYGIRKEFKETIGALISSSPAKQTNLLGQIAIKNYDDVLTYIKKLEGVNEREKAIEDFTKLIAIFTYFNKDLSLDVIYHLLGTDIETLQHVLSAPIFKEWNHSGIITYRIRTSLEANMLLNTYRIDIRSDCREVLVYLCILLYKVECGEFGSFTQSEIIEGVTRIISMIGPNGTTTSKEWKEAFYRWSPCVITALSKAGDRVKDDPRLLVQELTLSREYLRHKQETEGFVPLPYGEYFRFFADLQLGEAEMEKLKNGELTTLEVAENLGILSETDYEPILEEKIRRGEAFLESYATPETDRYAYFDHIRIELAAGLLLQNGEASLKTAITLCESVTNMSFSRHAVTTWIRVKSAMLSLYGDTNREAQGELLEEIISFAQKNMQINPELAEDYHFVKAFLDVMKANDRIMGSGYIRSLSASMERTNPTPAMIFCGAYAELNRCRLLVCHDDSIEWKALQDDEQAREQEKTLDAILKVMKQHTEAVTADIRCAYLYLQLYWLRSTRKPLNFREEKQYIAMKQEDWAFIHTLCAGMIELAEQDFDLYIVHCKYIQALARIQMEQYVTARQLLKEVSSSTDGMRSGASTLHIICDENKEPQKFIGKNVKFPITPRTGYTDVYSGSSRVLDRIRFNRYTVEDNDTGHLTDGMTLTNLMMGVGFKGMSMLRWEKERKEG